MTATTLTTSTTVKLGGSAHVDLTAIKDEAALTATIESMTKVELAEAWHVAKAAEKGCKDAADELEALRGKLAKRCDATMEKDELVTIHGNARKRFTVSAYTIENKGKVLDFILLDPTTPDEVKDRIRTMLATDDCRTPVRKLGFANPKKGQ